MKIICFSPTASFSVGIALLAIGAMTVRRARHMNELPYAAIPVIFGVQQLIEGGVWLGLSAQYPTAHILAVAYLLFSNVLWPVFVPLAVWMIEPSAQHRRRIAWTIMVGLAVGLFYLVAIISHPVGATIKALHIKYHLPHPHKHLVFTFYAMATCLAPLLSSLWTLRMLGITLCISMITAYVIYTMWFASVWCFFAALISAMVFLHFYARRGCLRALFA
ncbi:DUF6629 family protein [Aquisediminimonas sediminicola]|uniref:DUF6629 family protein n=1 Tax=Alteraquisediminimonas sediminicola TaxID=2676787 RepID=UPI001C8D3F85|nr:DUF6629 family protein [Aquisediminimonas sediminicola]